MYLFRVYDQYGFSATFCDYQKALANFERQGVRMYMYTKDLHPVKALIMWK